MQIQQNTIRLILIFLVGYAIIACGQTEQLTENGDTPSDSTTQGPGVYIDTLPEQQLANVLQFPETALPIFIGYTEFAADNNKSFYDSLVVVNSQLEFERYFGATSNSSFYLADAVRLYFANGGYKAMILSIGNYNDSIELGSPSSGLLKGLEIVAKQNKGTLLLAPDAVNLSTAEHAAFYQQCLLLCSQSLHRFAIINLPNPEGNLTNIEDFRTAIGTNALEFGAVYSPWLVNLQGKAIPPDGAVAGIYARVDSQRGVWKAPANQSLNSVAALQYEYSRAEQDQLMVDSTGGKAINPILKFPSRGIMVWGARTLQSSSSEWKYVPVRRMANSLRWSVSAYLQQFTQHQNNASNWTEIEQSISDFLNHLFRDGAFAGATAEESYFVQVGLGSTMTQNDLENNVLKVRIGFAPTRPAEFIVLPFEVELGE